MRILSGLAATALLAATGCASSPNFATGVIDRTSENTLSLVTSEGDTLIFSTPGADTLARLDSATVFWRGSYTAGMEVERIEVTPGGMPGSDRDAHGCIGSAGYIWSEVRQDCIRLFEQGIRMVDTAGNAAYIVFSPDSSQVELFFSDGTPNEILDRRRLPNGGSAWNVEDDDTKNVRLIDGRWDISRRGKTVFSEEQKGGSELGALQNRTYEGLLPAASCPGIRYTLTISSREHSGDGTFTLTMTYLEAENGEDRSYTYTGRRFTLRGMAGDENATVWQLVADSDKGTFNFLREDDTTLTLLNDRLEKPETTLNYSLRLKK